MITTDTMNIYGITGDEGQYNGKEIKIWSFLETDNTAQHMLYLYNIAQTNDYEKKPHRGA